MTRIAGRSSDAPEAAGPYSHSARIGAVVAAAGQVGATADGTVLDGVEAQTRQALANVLANLAANGATSDDVISVRVFLTQPSQFEAMNAVYAEFFTAPYPARTTVYVGLPEGLLVEIDALAVIS
jgi:2-iminobutanoate/2-iminopropanoate deaminase